MQKPVVVVKIHLVKSLSLLVNELFAFALSHSCSYQMINFLKLIF